MRLSAVLMTMFIVFAGNAFAANYNYISPETLKADIDKGSNMLIVDIQVEEEFAKHHINGSIPTYAYPVKSEADTAKLDTIIQQQKQTHESVVIVCPRGAGGAKRSYEYMKAKGVTEDKLLILKKGMEGWPYADLTSAK